MSDEVGSGKKEGGEERVVLSSARLTHPEGEHTHKKHTHRIGISIVTGRVRVIARSIVIATRVIVIRSRVEKEVCALALDCVCNAEQCVAKGSLHLKHSRVRKVFYEKNYFQSPISLQGLSLFEYRLK